MNGARSENSMMTRYPDYVLITPAYNEEMHIARLIESVAGQLHRPLAHVIVNDGSSDRTREIVQSYLGQLDYLMLLDKERHEQAGFGSKALAFNLGWEKIVNLEYDYIANLDADISLEPDYFVRLFQAFSRNDRLGLAGGWVYEKTSQGYKPQRIASFSVAGNVQCFRRRCLEMIGGYFPLPKGGIDTLAEIMARRQGWQTQTLRDLPVHTHRPVRTGRATLLGVRFNKGMVQYGVGYHPLYQLASCVYRLKEYPYVIGSLVMLAGYVWASLGAYPHQISQGLVEYVQREQLERLRRMIL